MEKGQSGENTNRTVFIIIGLLLLIIALAVILNMTEPEPPIVLTGYGNHRLVYDPNKYTPQAKTQEDILILYQYLTEVMLSLLEDNDIVGYSELETAHQNKDYRIMERIIYEHEVRKRRKGE